MKLLCQPKLFVLIRCKPGDLGFQSSQGRAVSLRAVRAVLCLLSPQRASAQHLEWLKTVKESHGSVELSSLSLAAAINSRGVYVLRAPADGQKVRSLKVTQLREPAGEAPTAPPPWGLLPQCSPGLRESLSPSHADNFCSGRSPWTVSFASPSRGARGTPRPPGSTRWRSSASCRTN